MKLPSPALLADRRARLVAAMHERDLAALVVYGNPSIFGVATGTHGHLRYLCGFTDRFAPSTLVLPAGGPPTLYAATLDAVAKARELSGLADVRREDPIRYGRAARQLLGRSARRARVGIVGRAEMPAPVASALLDGAPFRAVEADGLLHRLRLVKGPDEIASLRRSAALADRMFQVLFREAARGRWIYQVRARMELAAKLGGAEFATCWITTGPVPDRQRYMPDESWRRFAAGDQIISGLYLQYQGYWGHAIRMGMRGQPPEAVRESHRRMREVLEGARVEIRPGREVAALARHLGKTLARAFPGYGGLTFRPAHGIGLDYSERPISDFFPQPYAAVKGPRPPRLVFEPGMVLELHPNVMDPRVGFAALGDLCLVTADGCEALTRFSCDLATV
jgi:Xaa-Pro aminopeptidase